MDAKSFLVQAANEGHSWDVSALLGVAAHRGLSFTANELMTAADELWGNLSEDELRGVIGGSDGTGRQDLGPVDIVNPVPPLQEGNIWSPPPGDVSGNSCFFMRSR